MVEVVAERGYDATTVGHVCELAGVSKRAYYELFCGKPGCFSLAYERVLSATAHGVRATVDRDEQDRLLATLRALMSQVAGKPRAARFALTQGLDASPEGLERRERTLTLLEDAIADCLGELELMPVVRRGLAAGVLEVARSRVLEGDAYELPGLAGELAGWARCCARVAMMAGAPASAGARLRVGSSRAARRGSILSDGAGGAGEERGRRAQPRISRERRLLLEAAVALAAQGGALSVTGGALASESGVSKRRFNELFTGREECLLEALREGGAELLRGARAAGAEAESWQMRPARAVAELLSRLSQDPAFARAMFVESMTLGSAGLELRSALTREAARTLRAGIPQGHRPSMVECEASAGAVWGIVARHVAADATARLPRLAEAARLLLLAPAMGRRGRVGEASAEDASPGASLEAMSAA